ncbi:DUF397 domain-containing protein [Streptomyces antibioticus]|uniref:DUF397 domain-containing protein n=1 Tax=Streptomyces antibioticus TaxID=1890 RepID=UPI00378F968F
MNTPTTWQKSTFSGGGDGNNCLEVASTPTSFDAFTWQKSSLSGSGDGNACLELASTPTNLHLRESDTPATTLTAPLSSLAHLLAGIRVNALTDRRPAP